MQRILIGLLALGSAFAGAAEDSAPVRPAADEKQSPAAQQAAERDELMPGVPAAVLAAERTRRPAGNGVMDEMALGRTEITGNQELPKVLYIVPWRKSDPGDLTGKPVNTLLDEVLAPVDRTEFMRQIGYYGDLYGEK
ncbi:MAG: hypothetical protein BMS9Abin32_503 [Gammaproteobacteria bacterium]|nr:MAG: hypothetical protein BMS9Abin32_503 [Gammaproteobacteria bacterium]